MPSAGQMVRPGGGRLAPSAERRRLRPSGIAHQLVIAREKKKNRSARKAARRHKTPSRRHSVTGIGLTCGARTWSALFCFGELSIGLEVTCGASLIGLCAVLRVMSRP
jgi:hypothetical protein